MTACADHTPMYMLYSCILVLLLGITETKFGTPLRGYVVTRGKCFAPDCSFFDSQRHLFTTEHAGKPEAVREVAGCETAAAPETSSGG